MGKVLSLIISALLILLVFLFLGTLIKSCNGNPATDIVQDATEMVTENIESAGETIVAVAEGNEEFEGEDIDYSDSEDDGNSDSFDLGSDSGAAFEMEETEEPVYQAPTQEVKEEKKEVVKKATQTVSSSNSGPYTVIAGNYSEEGNANKMVKRLRDLGFSGAKKVVFDNSRFHTVITGYYNSNSEASSAKSSVSAKGIDCYVKKRS